MIDIDQPFNLVVGYISSTLKVTLQFRKVKKLAAALLPLRGSVFLGARNIEISQDPCENRENLIGLVVIEVLSFGQKTLASL